LVGLLTAEEFEELLSHCGIRMDQKQREVVLAPVDSVLYVVAGPGSGKTRALALRVLKVLFVDGLPPNAIMATTFTRRAAGELRSRIQGWGMQVWQRIPHRQHEVIDMGAIQVGTLDSLILDALRGLGRQYRNLAVADRYALQLLISRDPEFRELATQIPELREYSRQRPPRDLPEMFLDLRSRIIEYLVNDRAISEQLRMALQRFERLLEERHIIDYQRLNRLFYDLLMQQQIPDHLLQLRYLLVDEYQDTNPLQEEIYLSLGQICIKGGGGLFVVGDDDQALYRFRGATVEVFERFPSSVARKLGHHAKTVWLTVNYRSRRPIVDFANRFLALDPAYSGARVQGKPWITADRREPGPKVLLVSHNGWVKVESLLADLIARLAGPQGLDLCGERYQVSRLGDIAVLTYSPKEIAGGGQSNQTNLRFPGRLRQELESRGIAVFNPRGRPLSEVKAVSQLCGILLCCIDPQQKVQQQLRSDRAHSILKSWRFTAYTLALQHRDLKHFIDGGWITQLQADTQEISLLQLVYAALRWIPELYTSVEGLTYLELITRAITQAQLVSTAAGHIRANNDYLIREAIRTVLIPIAEGRLELDEELLETLPGDRVSIMSIHQAKGLEFPVVIVYLGPTPFDFPKSGNVEHFLEERFGPCSRLGRLSRTPIDRAFDDVIRRYYVAFTRAMDVLILVWDGPFPPTAGGERSVPGGWIRSGQCKAVELFQDVQFWGVTHVSTGPPRSHQNA